MPAGYDHQPRYLIKFSISPHQTSVHKRIHQPYPADTSRALLMNIDSFMRVDDYILIETADISIVLSIAQTLPGFNNQPIPRVVDNAMAK